MSEERFGRLRIDEDRDEQITGWEGEIPHLDYWHISYNHGKMTDRQKEFYKFVKAKLKEGIAIKNYIVQRYLLFYRDELLKNVNRAAMHNDVIAQIKLLKKVYNFTDYQLSEILKREASSVRKRRINYNKKREQARWIAVGEPIDINGHQLTRGGFYLGNYLMFSHYNCSSLDFNKTDYLVEGPVVSLDNPLPEHLLDPDLDTVYTTYVEMPEETQLALLEWLEGDNQPSQEVLAYYLSGIEYRLLADRRTTNDERKGLISHLYQLYRTPNLIHSNHNADLLFHVTSLIDYAVTRYFMNEAGEVLPNAFLARLPQLRRMRIAKALSEAQCEKTDHNAIIRAVTDSVTLPNKLPEVYNDTFIERLKTNLRLELGSRGTWVNPDEYRYKPIEYKYRYSLTDSLYNGLKVESYRFADVNASLLNKVVGAYDVLQFELNEYNRVCEFTTSPLIRGLSLPHWCDPLKMPGIDKSLESFNPDPSVGYRLVKISDVITAFGLPIQEVDDQVIEHLNMDLYRLKLRMGTSIFGKMKINLDEKVAILNREFADIPKRGTMPIVIYLVSWLLSGDKIKGHEYLLLDRWIDSVADNSNWGVSAKAIVRWLSGRKVTMSQKRKAKAETIAKYKNKRDEFVNLLLSIMSDPETATAKRMKRLEAIYTLIGLDPTDIHSDMHRLATSTSHKPMAKAAGRSTLSIDRSKLKEITQSTEKAQEILAQVFTDSDAQPQKAPDVKVKKSAKKASPAPTNNPTIEILRLLVNQAEWSRSEFEAICRKYGETAGSMLERLNDYSYDNIDEQVAEDDDETIYIDIDVAKQLIK